MANIVRYVVDKSLISGVVTCDICRYLDISTIVAVDEEYSKDDLFRKIILFSVSNHLDLELFDRKQALDYLLHTANKSRTIITNRSLSDFLYFRENGVEIDSIVLTISKTTITDVLDEEEINILRKLLEDGVTVYAYSTFDHQSIIDLV